MTRLKALNPDEATGKTKELFTAINNRFGMVPNMMRTMGNSPALLDGYLKLDASLSGGKLGAKTAGLIAIAVAESNYCNYCLSAHTYIGANLLKLDAETMTLARTGNAKDPKTNAILKFAKTLVGKKGLVNTDDVNALKSADVTDAEIAEIVGYVALNILTNYFNNTVAAEVDFPLVETTQVAVV